MKEHHTVRLFHGPGAFPEAMKATADGQLLCPPMGQEGIRVDDSRAVVQMMYSPRMGEVSGYLVLGPLDEAQSRAMDTLLKTVEEPPSPYNILILWANDIGNVPRTIRSRCLDIWCPLVQKVGDDTENEAAMLAAIRILEALKTRDLLVAVDTLKAWDKKETTILSSLSSALASEIGTDPWASEMWNRLRPVYLVRNPFISEILSALVSP